MSINMIKNCPVDWTKHILSIIFFKLPIFGSTFLVLTSSNDQPPPPAYWSCNALHPPPPPPPPMGANFATILLFPRLVDTVWLDYLLLVMVNCRSRWAGLQCVLWVDGQKNARRRWWRCGHCQTVPDIWQRPGRIRGTCRNVVSFFMTYEGMH